MILPSGARGASIEVPSRTLYGVGVGPGAPDLVTLRAAAVIQQVDVIAVPVARPDAESYALAIAEGWVSPQQTVVKLHFPMVRDLAARERQRAEAARIIVHHLGEDRSVAFLTEGDPLLHSTFGYVLEHLPAHVQVALVPGVSSIMAAAAEMGAPLVKADERLAILPATFENLSDLERIVADFDTVVLMKVHRVLDAVLDELDRCDLSGRAVLVERASHPLVRVLRGADLRGADAHYLSLLIVHTQRADDAT